MIFTEPPVISEAVKEALKSPVTCHAGDDATLKIPISGIPKPTATWTKGNKEIKPEDGDYFKRVKMILNL